MDNLALFPSLIATTVAKHSRELGRLVGQERRQRLLDDPGRDVEHDQDGGAEHDEGGAEAAEVPGDGKVDHLLMRKRKGNDKLHMMLTLASIYKNRQSAAELDKAQNEANQQYIKVFF